jgi:predicted membrane channel-forming protein YqfA (hemolysin III family)
VEACLSIRQRKFLGGVAMLIFVIVYALAAMALAQSRPIQEAPGLVQTLSYIVLGLAWTLPLLPLIKWMERRDDKIG